MGDPLRFDAERLRILIERHHLYTESARATELLQNWDKAVTRFASRSCPRIIAGRSSKCGPNAIPLARRPRPNDFLVLGNIRSRRMAKVTGFLEFERHDRGYEKARDARRKHWHEFVKPLPEPELNKQAAQLHGLWDPVLADQGCPVNNLISDWNNLVYREQWQAALTMLHSTNNFPEFTGRICPAPCVASCTLNIDDTPVTIKTIECAIVDRGWEEGWIKPLVPARRTGKNVAVIGSGPAGMACTQQLARVGHRVTLFEKSDRIGGLLRYGIPDFKMEKSYIDRRMCRADGGRRR